MPQVELNTIAVDGMSVFYRSAGPPTAPVLLLLHGFPASSFQFRELIPLLASKFRLLAPDLPGFGFTEVPAERKYQYTFDSLSLTTEAFLDALGVEKFAVYIFDYGVRASSFFSFFFPYFHVPRIYSAPSFTPRAQPSAPHADSK